MGTAGQAGNLPGALRAASVFLTVRIFTVYRSAEKECPCAPHCFNNCPISALLSPITPFLQPLSGCINKHDCILSGPVHADNNNRYYLFIVLGYELPGGHLLLFPQRPDSACLACSRCSIIFFVYCVSNEAPNVESSQMRATL